ncbi:DUF58 domain-containing protein [Marichromatium bheemlicum]|uniref:DUF58 domain-containing protein n=1 Tax=Marichromatium bheemlicum TaxID=365339 RepID=A0ABX1I4W5_9GAMM|nr:DUF58 domain-containing protein [Marichromatium bheemlicum]NKN32602.1 DUF58 domain-containing protein [Marichromatium bheemlicum]
MQQPGVRLDDLLELRHQARALGLPAHHLVNSPFAGLYASVFRGAGIHFEEVREYRAGDDIRYMDWKVTARTDAPHLKLFREERERAVLLCVERGAHLEFGTRNTFKSVQAARAAALIGWAASRLHDRVGGLVFGPRHARMIRPARGRRALWQLLRALAEPLDEVAITPLAVPLRRAAAGLPPGSLLFLIADLDQDQPGLETLLGELRQRHTLVLLALDDPADREIPAMGRVDFVGPDARRYQLDTDDPAARNAYRTAWEARRARLRASAHRLGVMLIPIATDTEIHLALVHGLARHARARARR